MVEWTTGCDYLPLYQVDGELNFSELLTRKHGLSVEDLSTGSNWQSRYSWMRIETVDILLHPYQSLTISQDVEELIEAEYFRDISPQP